MQDGSKVYKFANAYQMTKYKLTNIFNMKKALLLSAALVAGASVTNATNYKAQKAAGTPALATQTVKVEKKHSLLKNNLQVKAENSNGQVIAKTASGVNIVKKADGKIVKSIKKQKLGAKILNAKPMLYATNPTFEETFEGWDGVTANWLPTDWTKISNSGDLDLTNNPTWTWGAFAEGYDSKVSMCIANAFQLGTDASGKPTIAFKYQDESLVTPAITVAEGDRLAFILAYSPGWSLLNMETDAYTARNSNMVVRVSEDNGQTWTDIWNAIDNDASIHYTDTELDATLTGVSWIGATADLSKYVGKSIKIAFQYVGQGGEMMALDNVVVSSNVTADAYYYYPESQLSFALDLTAFKYSYPYAHIGEAYQPMTFESGSLFADTFEWEYTDSYTYEGAFASTRNLTVNNGYSITDYPILTTFAGQSEAKYQFGNFTSQDKQFSSFFQSGGAPQINYTEGLEYYSVVNFEYHDVTNLGLFGDFNSKGTIFSKILTDDYGTNCTATGVGMYVPAPESAYTLNCVYLELVTLTDPTDEPVDVIVYNDDLKEIARGSFSFADGEATQGNGFKVWNVPCYFYEKIGAIETPVQVTVDSEILVVLSFEGNQDFITPLYLSQDLQAAMGYYPIYVIGKDAEGNTALSSDICYYGKKDESGNWHTAVGFGMQLDVEYPWLFAVDGVNEYDYVPAAGGDATFNLDSYYVSDAWEFSGEGLDDWFTCEALTDEATSAQTLTVTLDPLPDGVDERVATIHVDCVGCKQITFYVAQRRDGSVSAIKANANRVAVAGGNFIVKSTKASACEVYNAAGQKVAAAQINGSAVIPAANLAKGIYVVKFNDNTVVKVMK